MLADYKEGFFLIPTRFWCKGLLPIDYRVECKKIDRRTRFYRNFGKWQINPTIAVTEAERFGLRVFREEGRVTRILATDGKSARAYFEHLQKMGFGKERA